MIPSQQGPLLSLRMKTTRTLPLEQQQQQLDYEHTMDRLTVMLQQEESTYKCRDYLSRVPPCADMPQVDSLCREKMCEWSFRVVDHFHANRDLVAVSFSYVDRFMDRVHLDRSAFKLAAMTCLHLATKILGDKEIPMTSLAELSRGEFEVEHMLEMESIILQTLQWRMHPPTAQCFLYHLLKMLSLESRPAVLRAVYHRACFFAELALFDYSFCTQSRCTIAVCAILNAMEGMDDQICSEEHQDLFVEKVEQYLHVKDPQDKLESLRSRLWYLYSQSAQYREDGVVQRTLLTDKDSDAMVQKKHGSGGELSPVSVSRTA